MQRNGDYPLISSYEGGLANIFGSEVSQNHQISNIIMIRNLIDENEEDYILESDNEEQQTYETDFAYLCEVLDKVNINFIYRCIFLIFININTNS